MTSPGGYQSKRLCTFGTEAERLSRSVCLSSFSVSSEKWEMRNQANQIGVSVPGRTPRDVLLRETPSGVVIVVRRGRIREGEKQRQTKRVRKQESEVEQERESGTEVYIRYTKTLMCPPIRVLLLRLFTSTWIRIRCIYFMMTIDEDEGRANRNENMTGEMPIIGRPFSRVNDKLEYNTKLASSSLRVVHSIYQESNNFPPEAVSTTSDLGTRVPSTRSGDASEKKTSNKQQAIGKNEPHTQKLGWTPEWRQSKKISNTINSDGEDWIDRLDIYVCKVTCEERGECSDGNRSDESDDRWAMKVWKRKRRGGRYDVAIPHYALYL